MPGRHDVDQTNVCHRLDYFVEELPHVATTLTTSLGDKIKLFVDVRPRPRSALL